VLGMVCVIWVCGKERELNDKKGVLDEEKALNERKRKIL
jgi:hypothetical protein